MPTATSVTEEAGLLPQYGFGVNIDFCSLVQDNPFLFRVYTPKDRSPFFDDTDPYFLAPKFNEQYARSPVEIKDHQQLLDSWEPNYADVAKHMDWTTRVSSPYISTSFSFAWCIWDAVRRFHQGVKKDVQVAIIDGRAISDQSMTAMQLLQKSLPTERNEDYWKWYRFSEESQSVLVYGSIPGSAVLASVPLLEILRHLPTYLLKPEHHLTNNDNPLTLIGWDYTERRPSFRRFCRTMSQRFLNLGVEERSADAVAGSLGLALAFLRSWFHKMVDVDIGEAVRTLCSLASIISQWPGPWWMHEHPEIYDSIQSMAKTLGEELREKHRLQVEGEVTRLQEVVDELHGAVREYEIKLTSMSKRRRKMKEEMSSRLSVSLTTPIKDTPTKTISSNTISQLPLRIQTPLTPPDSPRTSTFIPKKRTSKSTACFTPLMHVASQSTLKQIGLREGSIRPPLPHSDTDVTAVDRTLSRLPSLSDVSLIDDDKSSFQRMDSRIHSRIFALSPLPIQPLSLDNNPSIQPDISPENLPLPPSPDISDRNPEYIPLPPSPANDDDSWTMIISHVIEDGTNSDEGDDSTQVDEEEIVSSNRKDYSASVDTMTEPETTQSPPQSPTLVFASLPNVSEGMKYVPPKPRSGMFNEPLESDVSAIGVIERRAFRRTPTVLETAGCIVTGFVIGAIITFSLFSPQRRMIIHLT